VVAIGKLEHDRAVVAEGKIGRRRAPGKERATAHVGAEPKHLAASGARTPPEAAEDHEVIEKHASASVVLAATLPRSDERRRRRALRQPGPKQLQLVAGADGGRAVATTHRVQVASHQNVVVDASAVRLRDHVLEGGERTQPKFVIAALRPALEVDADDVQVEPARELEVPPEPRPQLIAARLAVRIHAGIGLKVTRARPSGVVQEPDMLRRLDRTGVEPHLVATTRVAIERSDE